MKRHRDGGLSKPCLVPDNCTPSPPPPPPRPLTPPLTPDPNLLLEYRPFPRNSVNLVTGPTSVGKTRFIKHLFDNFNVYFDAPVSRILVVQCNDRIQPIQFQLKDEVPVEHVSLSHFDPDQLSANDLVVMDDIQKVTDSIRMCISVCAHHYDLVSLFVVTHSILGHLNFELLSLVHRVLLFAKATPNVRLSKYIASHFFSDPELKTTLQEMVSFAHRQREILCIELSPKAGSGEAIDVPLMGATHLERLAHPTDAYCLVFPQPFAGMEYETSLGDTIESTATVDNLPPSLPKHTLVVVPVRSIRKKPSGAGGESSDGGGLCSQESDWNRTAEEIENNIDSFFKPARWKDCKNLAAEVLRNKNLCIYKNGRYFHRKGQPKIRVTMLDFLHHVTRKIGPRETSSGLEPHQERLYKQHVRQLRDLGSPMSIFKNRFLKP